MVDENITASTVLEGVSGTQGTSDLLTTRKGYWSNHVYHRLSVEKYVEEFCGWNTLKELLEYTNTQVEKAFLTTMFLTGARISETLSFSKRNFTILEDKKAIKVEGQRLLKRYRKIDEYLVNGKKHWHTQKLLYEIRRTYAISLLEPLSEILVSYVESLDNENDLLFASPYQNHHRNFNKKHGLPSRRKSDVINNTVNNKRKPYSRIWAYKLLRRINETLQDDLKARLGLFKVWIDEKGKHVVWLDGNGEKHNTGKGKNPDEIHLWLHWFRSQRASQLHADYGFDEIDLMNYFSWKDIQTATRYCKGSFQDQLKKMIGED